MLQSRITRGRELLFSGVCCWVDERKTTMILSRLPERCCRETWFTHQTHKYTAMSQCFHGKDSTERCLRAVLYVKIFIGESRMLGYTLTYCMASSSQNQGLYFLLLELQIHLKLLTFLLKYASMII